ncbi:MAG: YezD family protein [Clostridiales Family XIII bacterium]|jgi:hypothetical protein|nr:YezD family protein [Clostridiales Family XIII bacterium]
MKEELGMENYAGQSKKESVSRDDLVEIIKYVNQIQYGSVTIIIQDGHIVQIDKNEKIRMK